MLHRELLRVPYIVVVVVVVVVDELNHVLDLGLLHVEEVVETLLRKPSKTVVIITGR